MKADDIAGGKERVTAFGVLPGHVGEQATIEPAEQSVAALQCLGI